MSERMKAKRVVATSMLAGLGFLAGACGENEKEVNNTCVAAPVDAWQRMPTNINAKTIAQTLGVSVDQVRNGSFGPAECEKPVSPSDIDQRISHVSVTSIGSACLAVGLAGPPTAPQTAIIAACASEGVTA